MAIYILIIVFIVLFGLIIQQREPFYINLNNRKIYIIVIAVLFTFFVGLRDFSVGHDIRGYINFFNLLGSYDFKTLITDTPRGREKGFVVFSWVLYKIMPDGHFYLFIIAGICFLSIGYWLYKNSRYPIQSYLVFTCVFLTFFLTGLRQAIAISILLLALEQIKQKRIFNFILLVCLAILFHRTALIFFIAYLFFPSRISLTKVSIIGVAIPVLYRFRSAIFLWIAPIVKKEQYGILSQGEPFTFSLLLYTITLVCLVFNKKLIKKNPYATYYINSLLVACLFMPFAGVNANMMRLVIYFSIYLVLVIPELLSILEGENKHVKIISYIAFSVLFFMFFRNIMNSIAYQHKFFFQ